MCELAKDNNKISEIPKLVDNMSYYAQITLGKLDYPESLEIHTEAVNNILRYLSFVPIGNSSGLRIWDQEFRDLRTRLFEERRRRCEACNTDLTGRKFELHHTNYYKVDDPNFMKIVCLKCHHIIAEMTGLVRLFEIRVLDIINKDEEGLPDSSIHKPKKAEPL